MQSTWFYLSTLIFLFTSINTLAETKVYHWVDEQGKSHFSDTVSPGTEEVNISEHNLLINNQTVKNKLAQDDNIKGNTPVAIWYQASIVSPQDEQTIRSNAGTINIHVSTTPAKKSSQKLQLFLDGKALGQPQISPSISVQNIDRGTHQVQVHLLDENGKLLSKTQIVTVHLQRVSVINVQPQIN